MRLYQLLPNFTSRAAVAAVGCLQRYVRGPLVSLAPSSVRRASDSALDLACRVDARRGFRDMASPSAFGRHTILNRESNATHRQTPRSRSSSLSLEGLTRCLDCRPKLV